MYKKIVDEKKEVWVSISNQVANTITEPDKLVKGLFGNLFSKMFRSNITNEITEGEIGNKLTSEKGKFQKRLCKYVFKNYGIALDPEEVTRVWNQQSEKVCELGSFKITKDLTWDSGDYGDKGSCFWTCHSKGRIAIKNEPGMYAVIFKNNKGKGIGRMWMQVTAVGICTYNVYPNLSYRNEFNNHLQRYLQLDTKVKTAVTNGGTRGGWMYINMGSGTHLHNRTAISLSDWNLNMKEKEEDTYPEYSGRCIDCSRPVWNDVSHVSEESIKLPDYVDYYLKKPPKILLCYRCTNKQEGTYRCSCGKRYRSRKAIWTHMDGSNYVCRACIDYAAIIKGDRAYDASLFIQLPAESKKEIKSKYLYMPSTFSRSYLGYCWYLFDNKIIHSNATDVDMKMIERMEAERDLSLEDLIDGLDVDIYSVLIPNVIKIKQREEVANHVV